LLPCDVVARVAPATQQVAQLEVDIARELVAAGGPVAALDARVEPRAYEADDFVVTLWTYYESKRSPVPPLDYASAMAGLHTGMRAIEIDAPHFTDRVAEAEQLVAEHERTPELANEDRDFLSETLRTSKSLVASSGRDQLLHGEPHPGNLLNTRSGALFIDLETCCRGPVEFDIAHAPEPVGELYPNVDQDLLSACRILVQAMVTTWRWDRNDQFPNGRRLAREWLGELRAEIGRRPTSR
jgi:hypothetical protein